MAVNRQEHATSFVASSSFKPVHVIRGRQLRSLCSGLDVNAKCLLIDDLSLLVTSVDKLTVLLVSIHAFVMIPV